MKENYQKKNSIKINDLSLFIQVIMVSLVVIMFIVSIFINEFLPVAKIILGIVLIIIGYNNYRVFKRKGFTIVYIIIGIAVILSIFI